MNDGGELIREGGASPGRRRNVAARAWIHRAKSHHKFQSRVSFGDGRVHRRTTGTRNRGAALEFNLCHLLELLQKRRAKPAPDRPDGDGQLTIETL